MQIKIGVLPDFEVYTSNLGYEQRRNQTVEWITVTENEPNNEPRQANKS